MRRVGNPLNVSFYHCRSDSDGYPDAMKRHFLIILQILAALWIIASFIIAGQNENLEETLGYGLGASLPALLFILAVHYRRK